MDYKDTLLLPNTTFPMRGNLPQSEPKRYQNWDSKKVYEKMKKNREGRDSFTLHDGPPYANGDIHIGHALNKILKDIIVKYNYFQGKKVFYTPGWDCHGLPMEQQVEKKLGKDKKDALPKSKFRELCRAHAKEFIEKQMGGFKELGVLGDFETPYKTMEFRFEADIYRALCEIAKKGLLVERSKPVYWSWACQTALAEAEVEYEEKESDSIFVAFLLDSDAREALGEDRDAKVVIWTTTPWTLPANTGISLNPEEDYVLTQSGYIVAKKLHEKLCEGGVVDESVAKEFSGSILENTHAINPINGRKSKLILGEHVSMEDGSGAVHTAPGHGEDDYRIGLKYNLEVIMPVDERGCYDESIVKKALFKDPQSFVGEHIFKANEKILALLGDSLLKHTKIKHSYPHCWRSHTPLIFRATKQWFIAIDKHILGYEESLREISLKEIEKVKFYPEHGRNRLNSMIENRPDWCISRQRDWGVPIAFFRDKGTKEVIFDEDVLRNIASIFEEKGADAWWDLDIGDFLPKDSKYDAKNLEKVDDILDVWFDSGSTWYAVLKSGFFDAGEYPANMYLEGSDQHRGWFQSSLLVSSAINQVAPYKSILTHGFTVDENGQKMSKSKGNVIFPKDVLKEYGSEILRLWVALSDYQSDLKISKNILKQVSEQYRKVRNTLRFLLANVDGLDIVCESSEFGIFDKWILKEAKETFNKVDENFKKCDFSKAFHALNSFVTVRLSGIYLDMCKDRLYCDAKDSKRRVASQSAMVLITQALLTALAPILTYSVDEVLEHAPEVVKNGAADVFDLEAKELIEVSLDLDISSLIEAREKFYEAVDALKKEKKIKNTLELFVYSDSELFSKVPKEELEDWFIVSGVFAGGCDECISSFKVLDDNYYVALSNMDKCPRCWKQNAKGGEVCKRCAEVIS